MLLTTPYLNHSVKTALAQRATILENILGDNSANVKVGTEERPFGEDVRMVRQHTLSLKLLTPAEKDEAVAKYESGLTMTAIADEYGCHYTTIGRLLRQREVVIREQVATRF